MNQSQWDEKLKSFLKKTGEDVKRAGTEIRSEAEKLLKEVQDPERQAKLKAGMKDFGGWARKTAEEMAELMETGVKKAEVALSKATDKVVDFAVSQKNALKVPPSTGSPEAPGVGNEPDGAAAGPPAEARSEAASPSTGKGAKKSIGGARRKSGGKKSSAKKSIGKPPKVGGDPDA